MTAAEFQDFAEAWRGPIEAELERLVPSEQTPPATLHGAMRHAMFPGGKRLRPLLALVGARVTGGSIEAALTPAAGLELLHTYSLVHDDLPCMDDDDLRRGRPTCHKVYGDAMAVLAGDALLTLAFQAVAAGGAEAVACLAEAAGAAGMVGGQAADLEAEREDGAVPGLGVDDLERVRWIHDRKTGALIRASLEVGALAGGADAFDREVLRAYGDRIGRAFQIADDVLDLVGTAEEIGKQPGADVARGKLTYPAVVGVDAARDQAAALAAEAVALADRVCGADLLDTPRVTLDADRALLQDLASRIVSRSA